MVQRGGDTMCSPPTFFYLGTSCTSFKVISLSHPIFRSTLIWSVLVTNNKVRGITSSQHVGGHFFVFWSFHILKSSLQDRCLTFISCSESKNIVSYVFLILIFALKVHG